jgi:ABC-type phosphate/phosphonate transport system substrate-binding protein
MYIVIGQIVKRVLFFLLFLLCCGQVKAEDAGHRGDLDRGKALVVGFTPQAFFNVDPRDAIGAARVWIRQADRKLETPSETKVVYYTTQLEVESALARNEVDILVMIADEFINLRDAFDLEPVLSTDYGKRFYDELLLLVREESGITGVGQLRGKSLRIEGGQKGTIPMRWLNVMLQAKTSSSAREFFGNINEFPKASQIIMPVFFGQADSCIASLTSFETMAELNPQLSRRLRILEKSPGFVTGIIDAMIDALRDIDGDPKGKQVLTIFRINRLVNFKTEHLASVEKLFKAHRAKTEVTDRRNQ